MKIYNESAALEVTTLTESEEERKKRLAKHEEYIKLCEEERRKEKEFFSSVKNKMVHKTVTEEFDCCGNKAECDYDVFSVEAEINGERMTLKCSPMGVYEDYASLENQAARILTSNIKELMKLKGNNRVELI